MPTDDSPNTAVVVADNRETVLKAISTTLGKAGFAVLPASSAAQALDYCRDNNLRVQLVIIDAAAAGVNAAELESKLDEISPALRTLFLASAAQEKALREHLTPAGHLRRFLRKPFRRATLLGQVLEMTDRLVLTA